MPIVTLRLQKDDHDRLRAAAARQGTSVSHLLRRGALLLAAVTDEMGPLFDRADDGAADRARPP